VTFALESYGIPLFAQLTWQQVISIVDAHTSDPIEATLFLSHLVSRFDKKPVRLIIQLFKYGQDVILNIMSLRPEWILEPATRDAIIAFTLLNNMPHVQT
jgi:hypothetical protein